MKVRKEKGLTFDDVLLVPKHSDIRSRRDVTTATYLTPNIPLHIPIISANMDTVTESEMAIAMAHAGGIGIIHRFMTTARMAREVQRVKRAENIVIENPLTIAPEATVAQARRLMAEQGVGGLLVLDREQRLQGIVTSRDILFEDDPNRLIGEIMTKDVITARPGTSLEEARLICHRARIEKLPLVEESGRVVGLITTKDIIKRAKHPNATKDSKGRLRVGAAVGVKEGEKERAAAVVEAGVDVLVLDIAHGHSRNALEMMHFLKREFPNIPLIAGNVASGDGTLALIDAGADGVKVGVGPGSICLDADAMILTADSSVRAISEVQVGDGVVTHAGRVRPVTKTYRRWYQGPLVTLKVEGCPQRMRMTPNHEVLAISFDVPQKYRVKYGPHYLYSTNKHNKGLQWVRADQLKPHDLLVIPKRQYEVEHHVFDLTDVVPRYHRDDEKLWATKPARNPNPESYQALATRFATTKRVISTIVTGERQLVDDLSNRVNLDEVAYERVIQPATLPRLIPLDGPLMRLIGYYLAEGYVVGNENNRQLRFAFGQHERDYVEDVRELVSTIFDYDGTAVRATGRNAFEVLVHNHAIARFFELLIPRGAPNKRLPGYVLNQPRESLRQLLIGVLRGDGSLRDPRRIAYKTSSPHLAYQVAEVFTRLDYLPSIQSIDPRHNQWSTTYHVRIGGAQCVRFAAEFPELALSFPADVKPKQQIFADDQYIYVPLLSAELEEDQELEVFNLEVAKDHTYVANRVAVHNCITRVVTGFGVPQITALMDSYEVAHKQGIPIIADGGIRTSGDLTKALAAGAHSVMIGSLFAGTRESPGRILQKKGRRYKVTRGMASLEATMSRSDMQADQDWNAVVPEGVEAMVPYRGSITDLLTQLVGGLRSGLSYAGAQTIEELHENAEFLEMSNAGLSESKPHDVELM